MEKISDLSKNRLFWCDLQQILTKREYIIVYKHFVEGEKIVNIAKILKISQQKSYQLYKKSLERIKSYLLNK
jgi:DNA-directed RNA polymerase specialized sigma subunit